jgi:hypothetical protein
LSVGAEVGEVEAGKKVNKYFLVHKRSVHLVAFNAVNSAILSDFSFL